MAVRNPIKILVVADAERAGDTLADVLNGHDFYAECVSTGEKALETIWKDPPDFLLLSLELSGMTGLDVLRVVRQDSRSRKVPIITFSSQPDQSKILSAFNLEIDDYITEPFHPDELVARIRAVLNRRNPIHYYDKDILSKGKIQVHLAFHRVTCDGHEVRMTPKEYELLTLLMRKEGRVLQRQYLLEVLWGLSSDVSTRAVDMLVARLRRKLKREGSRWIETVQGYGYRISRS